MNVELLRRLTEAHGVPGQEDSIRAIVREELSGLCDLRTDAMGNLICRKAGKGAKPKRLMLAAHMDEIGFVVKYIDDKGFLRLHPLGGWDPRQMASQRVKVHARGGMLNGVLGAEVKPKHMLTGDEANKAIQIDQYFVDCGLSGEHAKEQVAAHEAHARKGIGDHRRGEHRADRGKRTVEKCVDHQLHKRKCG